MEKKKLDVSGVMGEVLSGVTRHYFQLLIVAWPSIALFVIMVVLGVQIDQSAWSPASPDDARKLGTDLAYKFNDKATLRDGAIAAGVVLLFILASVVACVRWHRFVLLGEGGAGQLGRVSFLRKEDFRYVWTWFKVLLVFSVVALVIGLGAAALYYGAMTMLAGDGASGGVQKLVMAMVGLACLVAVVYGLSIYFRSMLALPDAAVGHGGRVGFVLGRTSGNGFRLFCTIMLTSLLVGVIYSIIEFLSRKLIENLNLGDATAQTALVASTFLLVAAAYLYVLMAQITVLSVAYREIIGLSSSGGH
jgi:hypothetical protein